MQVRGVSAGKTVLLAACLGVTVLIPAAVSRRRGYFRPGPTPEIAARSSTPGTVGSGGSASRTFGGAIMPAHARIDVDGTAWMFQLV